MSVVMLRDITAFLLRVPSAIFGFLWKDYGLDPFLFTFIPFAIDVIPLFAFVRIFWHPVEIGPVNNKSVMEQFNWRKWALFFVVYVMIAALFLYGAHSACLSPLGQIIGFPAVIARSPVRALLLSPLLLLPRISWIVGKLTDTTFGTYVPLIYLPNVHRQLGWVTLILALVHTVGHFFLIFDTTALETVHLTQYDLLFPPWVLGWVALIGLIVCVLAGYIYYTYKEHQTCRINFEAFWFCHVIGAGVFFFFSAIHGMWRVLGPFPFFWTPLVAMLVLVLLDSIFRSRSGESIILSDQTIPIPNFGFELVVKTKLKCKDLSYVRMKLPGMLHMWHPFTVYSVTKIPETKERILRFLIQTVSDDKRRLGTSPFLRSLSSSSSSSYSSSFSSSL